MRSRRPVGVTILALLFCLNAGVYLLLTGLAIVSPGSLIALLHRLSPSGLGPETIHSSMGRFLPFYYGTMTVVTSAMAVGFWRLQNWARLAMLAMIALSLAFILPELRPLLQAPTAAAMSLTLVRFVLSGLWLWYLLRRSVRSAFRQPAAAEGVV